MVVAYIALGSNVGDRPANLAAAINTLQRAGGVRVEAVSDVINTAPVDAPPGSTAFLNAVMRLRTSRSPYGLLGLLLRTEKVLGRVRVGVRNAPRTIDLDLLVYGRVRVRSPTLTLPHPRMSTRPFVLVPLRQVARADLTGVLRMPEGGLP